MEIVVNCFIVNDDESIHNINFSIVEKELIKFRKIQLIELIVKLFPNAKEIYLNRVIISSHSHKFFLTPKKLVASYNPNEHLFKNDFITDKQLVQNHEIQNFYLNIVYSSLKKSFRTSPDKLKEFLDLHPNHEFTENPKSKLNNIKIEENLLSLCH